MKKSLWIFALLATLICAMPLSGCANNQQGDSSFVSDSLGGEDGSSSSEESDNESELAVYKYAENAEIVGADVVKKNGEYKFSVQFKSNYKPAEDFEVRVNGALISPMSGSYNYEVNNVTTALTITVSGVKENVHSVAFIGEGYSLSSAVDYVYGGENYTFTLQPKVGYEGTISVSYQLGANEEIALQGTDGKYIIPNITDDVKIFVSGAVKKQYIVSYRGGVTVSVPYGECIPVSPVDVADGYCLIGWTIDGVVETLDFPVCSTLEVAPCFGKIIGKETVDYMQKIADIEENLCSTDVQRTLEELYTLKCDYLTYCNYRLPAERTETPNAVKVVLNAIEQEISDRYQALLTRMKAVDKDNRDLLVSLYYQYEGFITQYAIQEASVENLDIISKFMSAIGYLENGEYGWSYDEAMESQKYSASKPGYDNITATVVPGSISWVKDWDWNVRFQTNGDASASDILIKMPKFNFKEHDRVSFYLATAYGAGSKVLGVYGAESLGSAANGGTDKHGYFDSVTITVENGYLYYNGEQKLKLSEEILRGEESLVLTFGAGMNTCVSGYYCYKNLEKI